MPGAAYAHHGMVFRCIHGGLVTLKSASRRGQFDGDNPIVLEDDLVGAKVACPLLVKPCTEVKRVLSGKVRASVIDGGTPLLASVIALTDSPGIVMASGASETSQISPPAVNVGASGSTRAPAAAPSSRSGSGDEKPSSKQLVLRLKLDREYVDGQHLPADALPGEVSVTVVQDKERRERTIPLPPDGSVRSVAFDLDGTKDAWVVVTSHPLVLGVRQLEPEDAAWPFLGHDERGPVQPTGAAQGFLTSRYADVIRAAEDADGLTEKQVHQANGLEVDPDARLAPPVGCVVRIPQRLKGGVVRTFNLRPTFPRLLGLELEMAGLQDVIAEQESSLAKGLEDRLQLAAFCKQVRDGEDGSKLGKVLVTTGRAFGSAVDRADDMLHDVFLDMHRDHVEALARTLKPRLERIRALIGTNRKAFPTLLREYSLFVATSPLFLGLVDLSAEASEDVRALALEATCMNPAVAIIREALDLVDRGVHLLDRLQAFPPSLEEKALTVKELETWRAWFDAAIELWHFVDAEPRQVTDAPGERIAWVKPARAPIRGWALLKKWADDVGLFKWGTPLAKKGLAYVRSQDSVRGWVENQRRLLERWKVAFSDDPKTVRRVTKLFGSTLNWIEAGGEKGLRLMKWLRSLQGPGSTTSKGKDAAKLERASVLGWYFGGVAVWHIIEEATRKPPPEVEDRDEFRLFLDDWKRKKALADAVLKVTETLVNQGRMAALAGVGRTPQSLKVASRGLRKFGKGLKYLGLVLEFGEYLRDYKEKDWDRLTMRAVSKVVPALLAFVPGGWLLSPLASWWLESKLAELDLTESERELQSILRQSEFGLDGCGAPMSIGPVPEGERPGREPNNKYVPQVVKALNESTRSMKRANAELAEFYAGIARGAHFADVRAYLAKLPWMVRAARLPSSIGVPLGRMIDGLVVSFRPMPHTGTVARVCLDTDGFGVPGVPPTFLIDTAFEEDGKGNVLLHLGLGLTAKGKARIVTVGDVGGNLDIDRTQPFPIFRDNEDGLLLFPPLKVIEKQRVILKGIKLPKEKRLHIVLGDHDVTAGRSYAEEFATEDDRQSRKRLEEVVKKEATLEILAPAGLKLSRVNVRKLSRKRGVRLDFKRRPVIGSWTYAPIPMTEPVELKVIDL